jgi:hypothetical protein
MLQAYRLCREYVILLSNSGYTNVPNYIYMYMATLVNEYEDYVFFIELHQHVAAS